MLKSSTTTNCALRTIASATPPRGPILSIRDDAESPEDPRAPASRRVARRRMRSVSLDCSLIRARPLVARCDHHTGGARWALMAAPNFQAGTGRHSWASPPMSSRSPGCAALLVAQWADPRRSRPDARSAALHSHGGTPPEDALTFEAVDLRLGA